MRPAVEHGTDPRERRTDARVVGRVDDVAGQRQAEPGAEAGALHRGDGGDRDASHAIDQRIEKIAQDRLTVLVERIGVRQVAPAAEGASFATDQQRAST